MRLLPRYHIENYFLDEHVLARVFESLEEPADSWLRDPIRIRQEIRKEAQACLSYAAALGVAHKLRTAAGNIDVMPAACHSQEVDALAQLFETRRQAESERVLGALDAATVEKHVRAEFGRLADCLARDDDQWQMLIPGKTVFQRFSSKTPIDSSVTHPRPAYA